MTNNNNIDALFADAELPFDHPGRRFDDTPEGFDQTPLLDQGPEQDYTPDEEGGVVHYAPGEPPHLWQRAHHRGLHRRPHWGYRLRRVPGAGRGGPAGPQRLPRPLPPLPAGDHRPGRGGVAPGRPEALSALRDEGMVTMGKRRRRN